MSQVVQIRRGNTANVSAYAGPVGEIILNITTMRPHVQDGVTLGGKALALVEDLAGAGNGDMVKATYDPTNKGSDAFNMDNMVEGTTNKILTSAERSKLANVDANATQNSPDAYLLDLANSTGNLPASRVAGLNDAITGKEDKTNKNVANGYAGLDGDGLISASQLPALAITDTYEVANQTAMLALSCQKGDIAIRTDLSKSFILSAQPPTTLANWKELKTPADVVLAVAGLTGAITASALKSALSLTKADVGLGNVDNTSDANKPISTAVQSALDDKWGASTTSIDYGTL